MRNLPLVVFRRLLVCDELLPSCSFEDSCFDFGFWRCHCDVSACGLLGSHNMLRSLLGFSFIFLICVLFTPTVPCRLKTVVALRHLLRMFDRCLLPRSLSRCAGSRQAFRAGSSRGPPDGSGGDWFGERGFGKAPICSAPSSPGNTGCDFPRRPLSQGARDRTRVRENDTKLTIIVAVQPFFPKELSLG